MQQTLLTDCLGSAAAGHRPDVNDGTQPQADSPIPSDAQILDADSCAGAYKPGAELSLRGVSGCGWLGLW